MGRVLRLRMAVPPFPPIAWLHWKHYHNRVMFPRRSGLLLHVASLPGIHGIGDLGDSALEFIEFLAGSGQKIWQVLPLNPTGYGDSPYQCFSAFAGNHLLINLAKLQAEGILEASDLHDQPKFPLDSVDFGSVILWKTAVLKRAATSFQRDARGE